MWAGAVRLLQITLSPDIPFPLTNTTYGLAHDPFKMVSTRSSSVRGDSPLSASATLPQRTRRTKNTIKSHTPTRGTLIWLAIAIPLVTWDTLYIFGRPHTMPGGWLHAPIWSPYELYGRVDYIYGFKAVEENNGFTAAQASLNVVETLMYVFYAWVFAGGDAGRAARFGNAAVLACFSAAVMTFSKTVLYWAIEAFNGAADVGHNDFWTLLIIWIIPK